MDEKAWPGPQVSRLTRDIAAGQPGWVGSVALEDGARQLVLLQQLGHLHLQDQAERLGRQLGEGSAASPASWDQAQRHPFREKLDIISDPWDYSGQVLSFLLSGPS